jgi:hypothetical protein
LCEPEYDFCSDEDGNILSQMEIYEIYHEACDEEILDNFVDQVDVFSSCDEQVYGQMTDCINELIAVDGLPADEAIHECGVGQENEKAQEYYTSTCEQEDSPDWCPFGLQKFIDTVYGYCLEDAANDY